MKFLSIVLYTVLCMGIHSIHAQTNIKSDTDKLMGTHREEIAQNMQTFMNSFNGTRISIQTSLKTFEESTDIETENIEQKDLNVPIIDDHVAEGIYDVYVISASDNINTYTYQVYWLNGKIHKIHQLSYRLKNY